MPGLSDQSMSSATATSNMSGMTVGGVYAPTTDTRKIPDFLAARMGGSQVTDSMPSGGTAFMLLAAAGLLAALLMMKKGK